MKLQTTVRYVSELERVIEDMFSVTEHFHLTMTQYLDLRQERLFDDPHYKRLPRWATSELAGYLTAKFRALHRKLEWRICLDGKYVKYVPRDRWSDAQPGAHFWPGTDKQFDPVATKD